MTTVRVHRAGGGLDLVLCGQSRDAAARLARLYAMRGLSVTVEHDDERIAPDPRCPECGGDGVVAGDQEMGTYLEPCPWCDEVEQRWHDDT